MLAGLALSQAEDQSQAIAILERAEAELAAAARACSSIGPRAELQRLGRQRRRRAEGMVGLALSDREREIAELVGAGKTSREIARECYLSEKTVERHLTHIFIKLNVTSRAGVAATLARSSGSSGLGPY